MFKITRVTPGEVNLFKVGFPEGEIIIRGEADFVVKMLRSVAESDSFVELVRRQIAGRTREEIAQKMRAAGFPEQIVVDFENGEFWADVIRTDSENGR